ncbi:MAG: hypothetical protein II239_04410 [Peptococcaceae bacterium]|nr:hypothetical protein [Peptococcaceae bacterium]
MKNKAKKSIIMLLILSLLFSTVQPVFASGITYMPDVTAEMASVDYWMALSDDADEVILTPEEIKTLNENSALASGTMIMDLRTAAETYDGIAKK